MPTSFAIVRLGEAPLKFPEDVVQRDRQDRGDAPIEVHFEAHRRRGVAWDRLKEWLEVVFFVLDDEAILVTTIRIAVTLTRAELKDPGSHDADGLRDNSHGTCVALHRSGFTSTTSSDKRSLDGRSNGVSHDKRFDFLR